MKLKYWRVVCRYGHVGTGREISVARHLETLPDLDIISVMDLAKRMPGVKARGVLEVRPITRDEWEIGRANEADNFYLQLLKTRRQAAS